MTPVRPDLRYERALLRAGARVVVGMDEVGRGALAGPVSVGAVAVDLSTRTCPQGVADSKLLTAAARERLLPALGRWGVARAVGHASADEIDEFGIVAALRLAGRRALEALGLPVDLVLLDGSHDWLSPPAQAALFDDDLPLADPGVAVRTRVKADRSCASVAAASVLAKCERDALMVALADEHPAYLWHENKGYGSPEHVEALRLLGPCVLHRRSWRLPVAGGEDVAVEGAGEAGVVLATAGTGADGRVAEPAAVGDGVVGGGPLETAAEVPRTDDGAVQADASMAAVGHGWSMMDA